ncbi:4-(cytidine 5'-diphospho)-2-C-methyl-D-erythritol kinase [Chloroflexota bacterium]
MLVLTISAPAKINLTLEVLGRRDDGYHEIRSVMQTISLCDTLSFEPAEEVYLRCAEPGLESPENLALKAASLLREVTQYPKGVRIRLVKSIPVTSGLGGGASDAAATLKEINKIWETGLSFQELVQLAPRLSSDTAFFLYGGTALVESRGEKVSPLPPCPATWLVLLMPPLPRMSSKTERLYGSLPASHFTQGQFADRAVESLSQGQWADPSLLFNVFESIAFDLFPGLDEYWRRFLEAGAASVYLAGSGPALFTLVKERAEAGRINHALQQLGLKSYLAQTLVAVDE